MVALVAFTYQPPGTPGGSTPASSLENVNTVAAGGAAQVLPDVDVATVHHVTLTAASCAFTFPPFPPAGKAKSFTLALTQDGAGGRLATFPASVRWAGGGAAPVLTVAATQTDVLTFLCLDGATWAAFVAGQNI